MASNSGFDITVPSGTSSVSDGDDTMRSMKSFSKEWWEEEHYATDGSSNSAGVHKPGSARIFTQSSAPTAVNIGQLWHDPDDDGLYVAEASGTGGWQVLTNSISLGATNTWTAKQTFSNVAVTGAVDDILGAKKTHNFASIAAGAFDTTTVTVTGATVGSPVIVGWTQQNINGMIIRGYVSATNTVTIVVNNTGISAINLDNQEFAVTVFNKTA